MEACNHEMEIVICLNDLLFSTDRSPGTAVEAVAANNWELSYIAVSIVYKVKCGLQEQPLIFELILGFILVYFYRSIVRVLFFQSYSPVQFWWSSWLSYSIWNNCIFFFFLTKVVLFIVFLYQSRLVEKNLYKHPSAKVRVHQRKFKT